MISIPHSFVVGSFYFYYSSFNLFFLISIYLRYPSLSFFKSYYFLQNESLQSGEGLIKKFWKKSTLALYPKVKANSPKSNKNFNVF